MGAICGIIGRKESAVVDAMTRAMAHRGPFTARTEGDGFAVAASEPIPSPPCLIDGTPCGRDGNALTPEQFRQRCNGVSQYAQLEFRGDFAAAVRLDDGAWLFARDRLGRHPLYYARCGDALIFASELKGLLASGLVPRRLNLAAVDQYLTLRCIPGPESIIRDVFRVRPGRVLRFAGGELAEEAFAGFDLVERPEKRDHASERVRELIHDAVERVPAEGLLWSAGVDCAALAAAKPGLRPVHVTLDRGWQDETRAARESARRMDLSLTVESARTFDDAAFTRAISCLDEPIADASILPMWLILERAARHAKVYVSGHGADDILGGYPRYHFMQKARGARGMMPAGLMTGIMPALPPNAFVRRGGRYLAALRDSFEAYLSLISVFDGDERGDLYTDAMKSAVHDHPDWQQELRKHFADSDMTRAVTSLELNVGIPQVLLAQCDRVSAAHGVRLHLPYLDDALVDYAAGLPPRVRFGVRAKPLLRMAVKGTVPPRTRLRARRYFKTPQEGRLARVLAGVTRQVISRDRVDAAGLFKWPCVEQVLRTAGHNIYRRRQYWALLMFFAWYREVMEK